MPVRAETNQHATNNILPNMITPLMPIKYPPNIKGPPMRAPIKPAMIAMINDFGLSRGMKGFFMS